LPKKNLRNLRIAARLFFPKQDTATFPKAMADAQAKR
jgi:hypothetical protein